MTLDLTAEQESLILDIARQNGTSPGDVLIETALWLQSLAEDQEERKLIAARIEEADRGVNWISSEEMDARVEKMLNRG